MEVRLSSAPSIVVVGGPNGAGKTTTAPFLLRDALGVREYVNAAPSQLACRRSRRSLLPLPQVG